MVSVAGRLVLIILVVLGGILALGIGFTTADRAPNTFTDNLCSLNSGLVDSLRLFFGKSLIPTPLCNKYSSGEIDATDWSECSEVYEETKDIKACATEQVANYANNCWRRYGYGDNVCITCTKPCYIFTIRNLADHEITRNEVEAVLNDPTLDFTLGSKNFEFDYIVGGGTAGSKTITLRSGGKYAVAYRRTPLSYLAGVHVEIKKA